ncbi:uncharacterized protein A1O9_00857 [Exophiala aquamarina CBS 119918]|uniref:Amine oxidase n=1 Tax=Exophiala aquamarina CBS 119918 TaxID=1182545 RepID=A0A072PU66_9EURO|nr:uncharacterized protein A1O9_00857 [Exophiala aquamarina CBS 119918]KEF62883.1 hypothetical protein A1O9_00857 [Exophiala aquamarina CBS 119918]
MSSPVRLQNPRALQDPTETFYAHIAAPEPGSQLVYFAGQVGADKQGNVPDDLVAQTRQALANVKSCLAEIGGTIRNIVHATTYVVNYDPETSGVIWPVYKEFLTDENGTYTPPGTLVPVPALAAPQFKVEIQVVAAVRPKSRPVDGATATAVITDVDVVVVGAGLSGLQAATDVQNAGLSVVVLEAKARVGGKTQVVKVGKGVLDVGAAWINDKTQPRMYELFKRFGFEPLVQRVKGDAFFRDAKTSKTRTVPYPDLLPLSEEEASVFQKIYASLDEDAKKIDLYDSTANVHIEDVSLGEYLRRHGAKDRMFSVWTAWFRALTGCEPDDIGLVYMLDYIKSGGGLSSLLSDGEGGAQYLRNRHGNQTISIRLAANLRPGSVHLNSPVSRITQTSDGALVETLSRSVFRARKVLVSIPTPLYKHITFSPPLPAAKQEIVGSTHLGAYSKCILVYSSPWWRSAGVNGGFFDLSGPVAFSRDVSSDEDGVFAIGCLLFGDYAVKWSRLPPAQRAKAVKDQLAEMVSEDHGELRRKVYDTVRVVEKQWLPEPWSEGAPCPMVAPGGNWARLGNELRRPFGNLHFIGTETAFEWKGYMEGAVLAGDRGAKEVVESLKEGGLHLQAKL